MKIYIVYQQIIRVFNLRGYTCLILMPLINQIYTILFNEYGPQGWWPVHGKYFPDCEDTFEIVVGAVLTQNTLWKNAERAIDNLRSNGLLDPEKIIQIEPETLSRFIKPSGYYNQKAARLKNISSFFLHFLKKKKVPGRDDLLKINGIGPETADSILLYAYNIPIFVVDSYTKRIFMRIGIIKKGDSYSDIQKLFMKTLPLDESLYNEYHALIVKHGKDICKRRPLCNVCILKKGSVCLY